MDDTASETNDEKNWEQVQLASAGQRIGNFLLDIAFVSILSALVEWGLRLLGFSEFNSEANLQSLGFMSVGKPLLIERTVVMAIYYTLQEWANGTTLGKLVTGTQVINDDGRDLTLMRAIGRTVCRFIPLELLSFLIPNPDGIKGWHDRIPRTLVITLRKPPVTPSSKKTWQS